jgi:undecaprenyl-diphosphatase
VWVRQRLDPDARYGLRVSLMAIAFVIIGVPFGFLLGQVATKGPITEVDERWARSLVTLTVDSRPVNDVMQVVSFMGKPVFLFIVVGVAGLWLLKRHEWRILTYLLMTTIVGGLIDTALKLLIGRPRPVFDATATGAFGNSFPSGHALASTVCYGAVLLVVFPYLNRRLRPMIAAAVVALLLLIGFSRLALGMHFVSDVLAGYLFGVAWLLVATAAFSVWRRERLRPAVHLDLEGVQPEHDEARAIAAAHRVLP